MNTFKNKNFDVTRAAAAAVASLWAIHSGAALASSNVNTAGPVVQGTSDGSNNYANNNPPSVISFAGQTALKNFNISGALTELEPGTSITLHDGTNGAPVVYTAPANTSGNSNNVGVQLASSSFSTADSWYNGSGTTEPVGNNTIGDNVIQNNSALLVQWHAEGSIDGFYDLINDEVGYAGGYAGTSISQASLRVPTAANATYYNTNSFTAAGSKSGFSVAAPTNLNNTYDSSVYNQATGANLEGAQSRIQFSVGEYPTEALAVTGTGSNGTGGASPFATPGSPGYGLGNIALTGQSVLTALGVGNSRQQFQNTSIANEALTTQNPTSPTATPNLDNDYVAGPWNTAGANNITSTPFAATAVTYSSNPGTGLTRLDLGDTQWLQTTGRLQNGALFNVVARTVDTGQRAVFALNTGIDPSWASGSNDDGNSTTTVQANAEHSIGTSYRVDGKTSGTEAETTIAQGRMSLGALSVPEANGDTAAAPVNSLAIDFNNQVDVTPANDSTNFVSANFQSIISSGISDTNPNAGGSAHYAAVLISHYNTVKAPNPTALNAEISDAQTNGSPQQTAVNNELVSLYGAGTNLGNATTAQIQQAAWAAIPSFDPTTAETDGTPSTPVSGIQGDPTGDVAAVLSNVINSGGTAATKGSPASLIDPADGLFSTGYLIPQLLDYTRTTDGGAITPVTLSSNAQAEQSYVLNSSGYASLFTAPSGNTTGSGAFYGDQNTVQAANGTFPAVNAYNGSTGAIPIDATNYLFGNFNENGVRDFSAVEQSVNAALSLAVADSSVFGGSHASSMYSGIANNTIITSQDNSNGTPGWAADNATKGDLIVLGDYNGDGSFNGADLYLLATGASLASSTSSNTLNATASTFADVVRDPNDVLRKNAALDYIQSYLNTSAAALANPAAAAFLKQSGAAVLSGSAVPFGATDLHTTDPVTGLEQFTYDPNGNNSFNPADVNRDGVIDFNDAVLVDQYNGQSYSNLTQSLAATEQAPVTGATEPLSLVTVQQVDGEAAIGSADLAVVSSSLTGTGNTNWYGYTLTKTGPGTINFGRTGGTVTVYSGAQFDINSGAVVVDGTVDPFTDNNAAGPGSTAGNHLKVVNNASLTVEGAADNVVLNGITGTGTLTVGDGTNASSVQLLANSGGSAQNALVINGSSKLDITNNHFTVADIGGPHDATFSNIVGWVASGVNGTPGGVITSSAGLPGYGVGVVDGNDGVLGTTVSAGTIEVAYTLDGDANLDDKVDITDFNIFAPNFGLPTTLGWEAGDFNYSGTVDIGDFNLFAGNFGLSDNGTDVSIPSSDVTALEAFATANGISVTLNNVPEPGSLTLLALAGAGTLARRRRKN